MKVGDLVRWKTSLYADERIGVVTEVSDNAISESQFDSGQYLVTVLWQQIDHSGKDSWKIKAHYLEVVEK